MEQNIQSIMKQRASSLKLRATPAELILLKILRKNKIRFKFQSPRWRAGQLRIFDFWIPTPYRLNIEVDGGYHNKQKDLFKDRMLRDKRPSFTVLRITNDEVINYPESTLENIKIAMRNCYKLRKSKRRNYECI